MPSHRNPNHHERRIAMSNPNEFDSTPHPVTDSPVYGQPQPPADAQPVYGAPSAPHYSTGMPTPAPSYPTPYNGPQRRTSGLAIASLVLGVIWVFWVGSVLAVIFGHVALSKTKNDPALGGRGLAIAGLVLGYIGVGTFLFWMLVFAGAAAEAAA